MQAGVQTPGQWTALCTIRAILLLPQSENWREIVKSATPLPTLPKHTHTLTHPYDTHIPTHTFPDVHTRTHSHMPAHTHSHTYMPHTQMLAWRVKNEIHVRVSKFVARFDTDSYGDFGKI